MPVELGVKIITECLKEEFEFAKENQLAFKCFTIKKSRELIFSLLIGHWMLKKRMVGFNVVL